MKGLLIKDFMLFKNQKQFLAICILIGGAFLAFYDNPSFVISYVSIMFTLFTISSITYDEYDNGMVYLFTLPISRKDYVTEKYIFGALSAAGALTLVSVLAWLSVFIRGTRYSVEDWGGALVASVIVITLFLCLMIPVQLKFKAEQSRIALFVVTGGFVLIVYLIAKLCEAVGIDVIEVLDRVINKSLAILLTGWVIGEIVVITVSYLITVRIMKYKEL